MELLWKEENICVLEGRVPLKIEVEGEVPLPEGKSATALLAAQSSLESCAAAKRQDGALLVEGRVFLRLLCQDAEEVFAFTSRASFTQVLEEAANAQEARCHAVLVAPLVKLESGALRFSCSIEGEALLLANRRARMLRDVDGLPERDLQLREAHCTQSLRQSGETLRLRLREELAMPDIAEVLQSSGDLQIRSRDTGEETLSGTLSLSLLLRDREGRIFQSLEHIPFRGEAEALQSGMRVGHCALLDLDVRSVGEEFGILCAEAELCAETYRLEERAFSLPADAYAPSFPFSCTMEECSALHEAGIFRFRSSMEAKLQVPEGLPEIHAPLYACAHPAVTAAAVENGRLFVEGVIEAQVVYANAAGSLYSFRDEIPFTLEEDAAQADIAHVQINALCALEGTGRTPRLQLLLCAGAALYREERLRYVSGIEECERKRGASGVVILFAGEGERLFDVAKRYNTTEAAIRALQPALGETLGEGTQVLMLL